MTGEVRRTFWKQERIQLVYRASTRAEVVPGSPSGMSLGGFIAQTTEEQAQFVSSRISGNLHAPALDIDFQTTETARADGASAVHILGPRPERKPWNALLKKLNACGLVSSAWVEAEHRRAHVLTTNGTIGPMPEIEFIVPTRVVPSSSTGHVHLYIEHKIPWGMYRQLLMALRHAGVIGRDFCEMCVNAKMSILLKPGLTKRALRAS